MGINTNVLTLGSPLHANTTFQHSPDTVPDPQASTSTGSAPGGSTAASGHDQSANAGDSATVGRKNAGASTQTRRTSASQIHGKAGATHAHTGASATSSQAGSTPQDAAEQSAGDFGSAMASALGRTTAHGTDSAPTAVAADTPANTSTPQQDQATPADAVAWFAQALMPAAAPVPALTDPTGAADAAGAATPAGTAIGSATTGNANAVAGLPPDLVATAADQTTSAIAAQLAAQNAAAGRFPGTAAGALRTRSSGAPQLPVPTAPTPDDPASASASALQLSDLATLNGAQKLISGLTEANPGDTDSASPAATPATHAASATDGMDAAQATAALQAASLIRPSTGLGGAILTIHAPVNSPAFADEVSARVTGLAQSGITQAQLQLNPADLGPVQVHITMQSGQASVWFGATHADTRAALEQSLPRLRELFAGAGMPLSDSGVFRDPQQQQQAQSLAAAGNSRTTLSEPQDAPTVTQITNIRLSLLDTYA